MHRHLLRTTLLLALLSASPSLAARPLRHGQTEATANAVPAPRRIALVVACVALGALAASRPRRPRRRLGRV